MNAFIVAYDVDTTVDSSKSASQVYSDVLNKIRTYAVSGQLTESCWLVQSNSSYVEIRNELMSLMRSCDRLLVVQSARIAAWHNLKSDSSWVKNNI